MKKKVTVLSQVVNSSLFGSDATFSHLIKSLSQVEAKNPAAQTDSAEANIEAAETAKEAFELDKKFIGLIDKKRLESPHQKRRRLQKCDELKQQSSKSRDVTRLKSTITVRFYILISLKNYKI